MPRGLSEEPRGRDTLTQAARNRRLPIRLLLNVAMFPALLLYFLAVLKRCGGNGHRALKYEYDLDTGSWM